MSSNEDRPREVGIHTDTIKLDSFLKWAGVADTGGHARYLVEAGAVSVNGSREHRRGRQLRVGDVVFVQGVGAFEVTREQAL